MSGDEIVSLLVENRICTAEECEGCSEGEVERIERSFGFSLPAPYREFLLAVGKGAGAFFWGTDAFFSSLSWLRAESAALLRENGVDFPLPASAFVFLMHQGYEFNYFDIADGAPFPVYQYTEGSGEPVRRCDSFDVFLWCSPACSSVGTSRTTATPAFSSPSRSP